VDGSRRPAQAYYGEPRKEISVQAQILAEKSEALASDSYYFLSGYDNSLTVEEQKFS